MGEHTTAYLGYGQKPPVKAVQTLAETASFARWSDAQKAIQRVADALAGFGEIATSLGIKPATKTSIQARLNETWQANRKLLR